MYFAEIYQSIHCLLLHGSLFMCRVAKQLKWNIGQTTRYVYTYTTCNTHKYWSDRLCAAALVWHQSYWQMLFVSQSLDRDCAHGLHYCFIYTTYGRHTHTHTCCS